MAKLITALVALAVSGAASGEREPDMLPLSGKWVANYDRDACQLAAQFGEGDKSVVAIFTRYQPGDSFDLTLAGKRLRNSEPTVDAKVDFGIRSDPEHEVMQGNLGGKPAIFFRSLRLDGWEGKEGSEPPKITPEQEKSVTGVTVSIQGRKPLRLVVANGFAKPMAALRTCMDDLLKSWGYDPAVQATLRQSVTPSASPASWIRDGDYPIAAIWGGHSGFVQFRLDIDPQGKIAGCHVLARTSPDDFADTTCRLLTKRASFKPALDGDGKPVRSYFISRVRFMMGSGF
nr:TonB family protein [uncultured Sphingomonas sp.]